MSKAKEADQEVEGLAIDSETMEMLDGEVKKGRARKFILIYKGAQIKKLIVFKKGPYQTRIQQAKKDGFRGEAVCGIVTGSGVSVTFQLAGNKEVAGAMSVDQPVDSEPTKTSKLKEFLSENDLTRKPEYQIIRDVSAVKKLDSEDDGAVSAASSAKPSAVTDATGPTPASAATAAPVSDADLEAQFQKAKSILQAKMQEAAGTNPAAKPELDRLMESAKEHEKTRSFGDGLGVFKKLAQKVKDSLESRGNNKEKYEANLPGAELKVKSLKEHPQSAAIKPEIESMEGHLKEAKRHALITKYAEANKALDELTNEYPYAKSVVDVVQIWRERITERRLDNNNLKLHQGISVIDPAKIKELDDKLAGLEAALKAREWDKLKTIRDDIDAKMAIFKQLANRHGDYVGLRNTALLHVQALEAHPNKDAIKIEIASIEKDMIDEAEKEYETNKSYEKARALLAKVDKQYDDAKKKADAQGQTAFKKEYAATQLKVKALDTDEKNKLATAEITAIKTKLKKADGYGGANQFPEASQLLATITKDCEAVEKLVAEQLALNKATKAAGDSTKTIDKNPKAAVEAVQKLHNQLKTHPQESIIRIELAEIQKKIDQAKVAIA